MTSISPVSTAVSAMNADRHQRGDQPPRQPRPQPVKAETLAEPAHEAVAQAAPPTESYLQLEGPFAASQLAERLRLLEANLRLISAGQKPWTPPPSDLNLRDRTV